MGESRMMTLISVVVLCLSLVTTSHSFSTGKLITKTSITSRTSIYGRRGEDEDDGCHSNKDNSNRRNFLVQSRNVILGGGATTTGWLSVLPQSASASAATSSASVVTTPTFSKDVYWPVGKVAFSLLPLAGTSTRRATVEECIIPNTIWTHDQIQGIVNVNVPVRQTVIKLSEASGGGLWVHNPVAPTPQLIKMMRKLESQYGPVRHIVLGTVALEHKATLGPFAQYFPNATVWVQPGQWSFPLQLPIQFLGVSQTGSKLQQIPPYPTNINTKKEGSNKKNKQQQQQQQQQEVVKGLPEWSADIEYDVLDPLRFKSVGAFSETAFFHKVSKSLIITDSVVSVTADPPKIIQEDPRAMLFHARDSIDEIVQDTEQSRKKGWRRMVQFGLVFFPSQIDVVSATDAISQASKIDPSMKPLGEGAVPFSLYPWKWHDNDADLQNFQVISNGGRLFCPPILTKLILDREPTKTLEWVDRVSKRFDFQRIIPGHLNNNVKATPKEFREAFQVLRNNPTKGQVVPQRPLPEDLALLQKASDLLTDFGVVGQSQVCDLEPARKVGRFATTKI